MSKMRPQAELIKLANVRVSYPSVFNKRSWKDSTNEPKYECTFILDKELHKSEINNINTIINNLLTENKIKRESIAHNNFCLRDGDLMGRDEYANSYVIKSTSKNRIIILGKDAKTPIVEDDNLIYGGCYVNSAISLFAYNKISTGIASNFHAIQFVKHGDSFSGLHIDTNDFFSSIEDTNDDELFL